MTDPTVALVTVASPSYRAFAEDLMESATDLIDGAFVPWILDGEEGWPCGTECRHGIFAEWLSRTDTEVAYLLDADLLVEEPFDLADILPPTPGIVATLHPGYVGMPREHLPYERDPDSCAYMPEHAGTHYFCGGVVGGTRDAILGLSTRIAGMIERDAEGGVHAQWHDESCLNFLLAVNGPILTLDPSFCHPDSDRFYVENVWHGDLPRHIVALDKSPAERVGR